MTFLHPAILFGLLAMGLPVAIHILSRPRLRRIRWAATKFLLTSVQKNRRRIQMEDLILLALRMLLIALLVIVFARPALLTEEAPKITGLAAPGVILLDNSASMGQSNGVETRFDAAKSMADDLLTRLAPGSSSALYLVSDRVKAVVPKPTEDLAILRRSIEQAELPAGGSDLYSGIKMAVDQLKSLPGTHREIYVLTDSQQAAWRDLAKVRDLEIANKDIALHVLTVGEGGEDNLAVSALELTGGVAAVDQPLHCAIRVSNWSQSAAQNIPVKLAVDGEPPQDEGMIDVIAPGASRTITLVAHVRKAGYHSLTATIPGDRLPSDNQRSTALLVLDQVNALIVEGTTNADPAERDGFFLGHALVPVSPDKAGQYYVKVTAAQTDALENPSIDKYQLIFLSNVAQLTQGAAENLRQYVSNGGALIIFPGPTTDPAYYNSGAVFSSLLPTTLGAPQGPPHDQPFLSWQSKDYEHPLTTLWNEPSSGSLGGVRVTKYFPLTLKPAANAQAIPPQIVVKYSDGEPAVVEQKIGKGKVILFSSTATTAWTTLPIHPSFVPLLIRTIAYATSGLSGTLNIAPGQTFSMPVPAELAGKSVTVLRPGEQKRRVVGEVGGSEGGAVLSDADTEQAGPYQLFIGDERKAVFAVQGDPDESNLAQVSKTDLDSLTHPRAATVSKNEASANASKPSTAQHRVPGRELWFPFALAALLLALLETALGHRFSQSK